MNRAALTTVKKTMACMVMLVLLCATLAPALWRMDCLVSGRSMVTWGKAAPCMPAKERADHDRLDVQCCDFSSAAVPQLDYVRSNAVGLPLSWHAWDLPARVFSIPVPGDHVIRIPARPPPKRTTRTVVALRSLLI